MPLLLLVVILGAAVLLPMLGAGRSPHVLYRSSEIDTSLDDVKGMPVVVEEVVKTLNLFLAYKTFREHDGRHAAPGDPLRGPARHRQDLHGQGDGHARPACRSCSCRRRRSSRCTTARPTARSAPTSRRCARRPARRAAPSASSRRSTPSAAPAPAWAASTGREGISGVVNELLIQLQSFDTPTGGVAAARLVHRPGQPLAARRTASSASRPPPPANILVIGATNRAADLDPALLRPGRFDRSIHFDLPEPVAAGARSSTTTSTKKAHVARARRGRAARHARGDDVRATRR